MSFFFYNTFETRDKYFNKFRSILLCDVSPDTEGTNQDTDPQPGNQLRVEADCTHLQDQKKRNVYATIKRNVTRERERVV